MLTTFQKIALQAITSQSNIGLYYTIKVQLRNT